MNLKRLEAFYIFHLQEITKREREREREREKQMGESCSLWDIKQQHRTLVFINMSQSTNRKDR
jgi:hypothetical protein